MKRYSITVNGNTYDVQVEEVAAGAPSPVAPVVAAPAPVAAPAAPAAPAPVAPTAPPVTTEAPAGATGVEAPMPGTILDIKVTVGQQVAVNEVLLILEAMKMENEIVASSGGVVSGIHVAKGDSVNTGTLMISLS